MLLPTLALAAETHSQTVLVVGDSLSAGYGINPEKGWVTLLNKKLEDVYSPMTFVNKSVSGSTTQNGLDRLPSLLTEFHPNLVILALGSNDGLRGTPLMNTQNNLKKMIELSQQSGAKVLLIGFMIPPNYGPLYTKQFTQLFPELAEEYELPFVPFLMEGVAEDPKYMQQDNLHPNEAAQPRMMENVWKIFRAMIRK